MGFKAYLGKRIVYCIVLLWAIMTVNFIIFAMMPGDPIGTWVRNQKGHVTEQEIQALRRVYGLDLPMHEKYFLYLQNMLTWNFGRSRYTQSDIKSDIIMRLGNTLILLSLADGITIFFGTLLGVLIAWKRGSKLDTGLVSFSLATYSLPVFWLGWLFLFFFAVQLRWFPLGGIYPVSWLTNPPSSIIELILGRLSHLVLPVATLLIFNVGGWLLLTRSCMLEAITEDFVVTAKAKGLKERTVLLKHVLRVASLPLVTSIALTIAGLWSGAIITETVFSYEGMGRWIWSAIGTQDVPIMYVVFYISALTVVIANLMVDLFYGVLDPRIRVGR